MLENSTKSDDDLCKIAVAPYAGAWIETVKAILSAQDKGVAPYAGAWIETFKMYAKKTKTDRRSLRGSVD